MARKTCGGRLIMSNLTPRIDRLEPNRIINGTFDFWQRGTGPFTTNVYTADRFQRDKSSAPAWTWSQSTDVPTVAQSGFASNYSLLMEADGTGVPAVGEYAQMNYKIEGHDIMDLLGKTVTLFFWAKTNKTGTYCVSFQNTARDRSYIKEYSMDSSDTWELKAVALPFDAIGTWLTDNTVGLRIQWMFQAGTSFQNTPNTWHTSDVRVTNNQVDFFDSASNEFRITQIMLLPGDLTATDSVSFRRSEDTITKEFTSCQRYYCKSNASDAGPVISSLTGRAGVGPATSATETWVHVDYPVEMRANPQVTLFDNSGNSGRIHRIGIADHPNAASVTLGDNTGFRRINSTALATTHPTNIYVCGWTAESEL